MPIPKSRLEEAQKPLPDRILLFLQGNPDKAFNALEVAVMMDGYDQTMLTILGSMRQPVPNLGPVAATLKLLAQHKKVVAATYQGQLYYAAVS
ncbi:MAG: hypothetical protein HYY93_02765 [Planctomycetes bacterium]|nr:hypothetical protein [Planctomycetota bacterium]